MTTTEECSGVTACESECCRFGQKFSHDVIATRSLLIPLGASEHRQHTRATPNESFRSSMDQLPDVSSPQGGMASK